MNINMSKDFVWGAASAAYQIEGAWKEDDRQPCMWDHICHAYDYLTDNGDVACDHYHRYKDDVKLMKEMGLKGYRFSISWSRLILDKEGTVNPKGLRFYSDLIDELLKNGIEPFVTLLHFDTPMYYESEGGWINRAVIEGFVKYANIVFDFFGDRVNKWITINEPYILANMYRMTAKMSGGDPAKAAFQASHYMTVAHARVVKLFREHPKDLGVIGHAPNLSMVYPENDSQNVKENAEIADLFFNQWYLDPALKGEYPKKALDLLDEYDIKIDMTNDDLKTISNNLSDFVGVNTYSRMIIKDSFDLKTYSVDTMALTDTKRDDANAEYTAYDWEVFPQGMYDLLIYLKNNYNNPMVFITENGAAYNDENVNENEVQDDDRIKYLESYISKMQEAIQDGANVKGYFVWTLMDNFEWSKGYSIKMGLIHVDFATQQRTFKKSAKWYKSLIEKI